MFHVVEKYKTSAQIVLGIICLSFVFAGGYSLTFTGKDYISKIGDIKIKVNDVNDYQRRYQNNTQKQISKKAIYETLLDQAYVQQEASDIGVSVSLEQIKKIIASDPGFQEDGKFSEKKYHDFLQQSGMTEHMLIDGIHKQYAMQTIFNLMNAGNIVSDFQAKQIINMLQASRQMQTITFPSSAYTNKVVADDTKLQAYYSSNKKQYFQPLGVKYEFVQLSAAELGSKEVVSDAELKEAYDQIPSSASAPKPTLDKIKTQLTQEIQMRKGTASLAKVKEQLSDLAFNNPKSLQPISDKLGLKINKIDQFWVTKELAQTNQMPQNLLDILFSNDFINKRYNSEPIDIGNGNYWVVRAIDVRKEHQATFAEVKAQVERDYIAAETKKLALNAANQAYAAESKGKNHAALSWSASTTLTPQQAIALMSSEDFQSWIKAKPSNGKPAYVLLTSQQNPTLIKITSITPPKDISDILPQAKQMISFNQMQALVDSNLQWLKIQYKLKQGAQKLDADDQ